MKQANKEIRTAMNKRGVRFYQVAKALGVHPSTFTCWLRDELTPERKAEVLKAIASIKE